MDLILWRHAEAEDPREGMSDLQRVLTAKGEKQAARVGAWLDRVLPQGTRILCSPARRCEQTAQALGRRFSLRDVLAPGATAADVLAAAQWPEARHPVMVVGHQPTLGQVVAHLMAITGGECAVRKGSAWWLRARVREAGLECVVVAVLAPDAL
ncbi:SixA phosphatase family protein [Ramlibacter sp. MMS24-I3-19]|uniref:SixA phosphatase family protein n=1 Tax=Ramlibacter sp. MMS24-I3-19 TaxID=3416606 RepID=UPI003CFE3329